MIDHYTETADEELAGRAKAGDREAFAELVRRHRAGVYGYAQSITQEKHLAEDIVQDALIRAFIHMGRLNDPARFLPWLQTIVRNQAYTRLGSRRHQAERSFSALLSSVGTELPEENWRNLDYILARLSRSVPRTDGDADPSARIDRMAFLGMIGAMLRVLNKKERQIFESHFFDHLSPSEIAALFRTTSANVYQILSRSRRKVMQERLRVVVDHYIRERKDSGQMKTVKLQKPAGGGCSWHTAGDAVHRMLAYTENPATLPAVMGYTGLAFRINLLPGDVHIAGPTSYDFSSVLSAGLANLGYRAAVVTGLSPELGENANLVDPSELTAEAKEKRKLHERLPEALELIHRSLDRGLPVVAWDLFIPEFGIIYGYDDEKRELFPSECGREDPVPYEHLGRGFLEDLFVMGIEASAPAPLRSRLRSALEGIVRHYRGQEPASPRTVVGLAAYDAWIEALRGGEVEPNGNAYNAAVVQDCRRLAADFLGELAAGWQGEAAADERIRSLSREAARQYGDAAEELRGLTSLFPFPEGGAPNEPDQAKRAIAILEAVKALETEGCLLLEAMLAELGE